VTTPDYAAAYEYARARATEYGHDMCIRGHREYGKLVFTVRGACAADSDYARYEIVHPGSPTVVLSPTRRES
jgi:hypothetical protein